MTENSAPVSPRWGFVTKLVVTLTFMVLLGLLVGRFLNIFAPIILALILAYLLHPLPAWINRKTPLSWKLIVNILYLIILIILLSLLTWGGVGLIGQIQNLIGAIQNYATQLPSFIESLSHQIYYLGPLKIDLSSIDWMTIGQQILSYVQPALGQLGGLVGTLAGSAVAVLGWTFFVLIVSYFLLLESGGLREGILRFDLPGYTDDIRRLSQMLSKIWNAFLRGQLIIFFSKVITYTLLMTLLGVHYALGVALIAGFASFLPYIGPAINWIVLGLITYFQGANTFGFPPLVFTIVAIAVGLVIDQAFDNLVAPRIMSQALKVHPAFVLIAAIIGANLFGLMGIILAAPLLATLQLIGRYTLRKLFDQDPWQPGDDIPQDSIRVPGWLRRLRRLWRRVRTRKDAKAGVRAADLQESPPGSSKKKLTPNSTHSKRSEHGQE